DPEAGVMGMSAVVGSTIPNAVGYAYALKYRREDRVVASFFGDGATEEGVFAESLNFAALKRLPLLFVCENNRYAIHTHQSRRQGATDICAKARAFGVPAERVEDNDVLALYERVRDLAPRVRGGAGPPFLEVLPYRWREHVGPGFDYPLGFRSEDECEPWILGDQVIRLAKLLDEPTRRRIQDETEKEVAAAFAFAEASAEPG